MRRRAFLLGAAGVVGASGLGWGQGQTPTGQAPPAGQGAGRGGGGGGRGGPANVPAAKLARIGIMTLNHGSMLRLPWNASPNPNQTLALMDLPQYLHRHVRRQECRIPARPSGAGHDQSGSGVLQRAEGEAGRRRIAGQPDQHRDRRHGADGGGRQGGRPGGRRACGVAHDGQEMGRRRAAPRHQAVDAQSGGAHGRLQGRRHLALEGTAGLRQAEGDHDLQRDARQPARPLRRRCEAARRPPPPPPPAPAMPEDERLRYVWGILNECIEKSGGYSNLDFGGAGRFTNQQQLHDAIKGLMKRNSGSMHIKSSPDWDIGKASRSPNRSGSRVSTRSR